MQYKGIEFDRHDKVGDYTVHGNTTGEDTFNKLIIEFPDGFMVFHENNGSINALEECVRVIGFVNSAETIRRMLAEGNDLYGASIVNLEEVQQ